jgi:Fe-S-cluster containining protein
MVSASLTRVPDVPECLACGTCCFSLLDTFVRVSGDDYARLGERAEALVWFDGTRAYMRMTDGHCGALEIDARTGRFVCSTYATRPQVCRDLARASPACLGEREMKAERPLLVSRLHDSFNKS